MRGASRMFTPLTTPAAVHARSIGSAEVAARTRHLLTHTSWTVRHPFVQHASLL